VGLPHLEAKGNRKTILSLTEKITYFFASNIFCNSLNLQKMVSSMTKKSVNVIGNGSVNGVDTEFFKNTFAKEQKQKILEKIGFSKNHFVITFVGRIVKDKGINELVHVFSLLSQEYSHLRLLLIGDYKNESDPISVESKNMIEKNSRIKYLEFQEDVREYLAVSNLFILPSYREGLPNVLIEAGSYGVPMIATDINGCNEVIENNVNGLLVKKKDLGALSGAIQKFVEDTSFYDRIQTNVRESIVSKYNQKYFWTELLYEFRKIESVK
jgi:glycosyltransferase involved in cell wall biosynthesis